jgi:hypothetical protein
VNFSRVLHLSSSDSWKCDQNSHQKNRLDMRDDEFIDWIQQNYGDAVAQQFSRELRKSSKAQSLESQMQSLRHIIQQRAPETPFPPVRFSSSLVKVPEAPVLEYTAPPNLIHVAEFQLTIASLAEQISLRLPSDPNALLKIKAREFEHLVAELMVKAGYSVELTKQTRDGGVDIYALKSDAFGRFLTIVDCKKYAKHRTIGPSLVRTLYGTLNINKASHGIIATTTTFTNGALSLAEEYAFRISLKDHDDILSWIQLSTKS